jgi:hypothetical protein
VALVYASAFAGAKDPMGLRRLLLAWRARDIRATLRQAPAWSLGLPLPLAVATLLLLAPPPEMAGTGGHFRLALVAAQFFMLRDLALLLFFNLAPNRKRADMLSVLWLALLWLVIPLILSGLGLDRLTALFHPLGEEHVLLSVLAAPCAMLLAVWLATRRWKANYALAGRDKNPAPR